jgi:hypothetical protein
MTRRLLASGAILTGLIALSVLSGFRGSKQSLGEAALRAAAVRLPSGIATRVQPFIAALTPVAAVRVPGSATRVVTAGTYPESAGFGQFGVAILIVVSVAIPTTARMTGGLDFSQVVIAVATWRVRDGDIKHNGKPVTATETIPGSIDLVNPDILALGWRAFVRLGIFKQPKDELGDDSRILAEHGAAMDFYLRAAQLPEGEPFETPIKSSAYPAVYERWVDFLQTVYVTRLLFFGSNDFIVGDVSQRSLEIFRDLLTVDQRKVDHLVRRRLGLQPRQPASSITERDLLRVFNDLLNETELILEIDRKPKDPVGDEDISRTYPELGNLISNGKNDIQWYKEQGKSVPPRSQARTLNRALLETLFPQAVRKSRPTPEQVQPLVLQGIFDSMDPVASYKYYKPLIGITKTPDGFLTAAEGSLLARAGKSVALFLEVLKGAGSKYTLQDSFFKRINRLPDAERLQVLIAYFRMLQPWIAAHELTHRLALIIPQVRQPGVSDVEWKWLQSFSVDRWRDILFPAEMLQKKILPEISTSALAAKDVFKAVVIGTNAADNFTHQVLEMLADRFGLFAVRVDQEISAYQKAYSQAGKAELAPQDAYQMWDIEARALVDHLRDQGMADAQFDRLANGPAAAGPSRRNFLLGGVAINVEELAICQTALGRPNLTLRDLFVMRDQARSAFLAKNGLSAAQAQALDARLKAIAADPLFEQLSTTMQNPPDLLRGLIHSVTDEEEYFFRQLSAYAADKLRRGEGGGSTRSHAESQSFVAVTRPVNNCGLEQLR